MSHSRSPPAAHVCSPPAAHPQPTRSPPAAHVCSPPAAHVCSKTWYTRTRTMCVVLLLMHTHSLALPLPSLSSPLAHHNLLLLPPSQVSSYSLTITPSLPFMVTLPHYYLPPLSLLITPSLLPLPITPSLPSWLHSLPFPVCPPMACLSSMPVEPSQSESI